ncbi:hypothetical protein CFP56_014157 [Quercus suber]|uniref:Uncharacterized protein n=1 Tax=Quercus suber TaxID=58331 RepID=A0AAW0KUE3_QUESU
MLNRVSGPLCMYRARTDPDLAYLSLEGYLITGELKLFSRTLSCLGDKRTSNFYLGETMHGIYWLAYIDVEVELFLKVFSFLFIYVLVN